MDKLKRFIDIWVPVTTCTLRCHYCYITHHRLFGGPLPTFKYDVDTFRKGFSKERLGGTCMINLCGGGETLLPPEMPQYIKALLSEGHYVMVVTNGTVDKAFDEIIKFPKEYLERLFFKFSYPISFPFCMLESVQIKCIYFNTIIIQALKSFFNNI